MHGILIVLLAAAATPNAGKRLELASVIEHVQKRYDSTNDYQAGFEQAQLNAAFGRTTRSSGTVSFKKPGRMRWDYEQPEKKMFVSNGQTLWLYEPEDQQAFKQSLKSSQLPAALAFLMGRGKLSDEFTISFAKGVPYGKPVDYVLSLDPKQPQGKYKNIYFVVDPESFHVRETVLVDAQSNVNDITLVNMKVNVKLADDLFKWSPPSGVRVVDAGKLGK